MPATDFENTVNEFRGYACFVITVSSLYIVLEQPGCLLFWTAQGYQLNVATTGMIGLATSAFFLLYLVVDTLCGLLCRHKFRRSMAAVIVHHVVVAAAIGCFLLPSPPRGFFLYVWGEALTAVRLLPPGPRWHARSLVFGARRCLWTYLFCRDLAFFGETSAHFGIAGATAPLLVAVLLLALDWMWWREHARSGAGRHKKRPSKEAERTRGADEAMRHSEDESGQLLLPDAPQANCGLRDGSQLPSQAGTPSAVPPRRCDAADGPGRMLNGHVNGASPRAVVAVDLEAARSISYDDLQIHTP